MLETIHHEKTIPGTSSLEDDLSTLNSHLSPTEPRYILLQYAPNETAFIMYVPDHAKVRSKMLYASSSAALQRAMGGAFATQVFWTELDEVSHKGWKAHLKHEELGAPLTEEERSLQDVREKEAEQMLGTNARKGHVDFASGGSQVAINIDSNAKQALESLATSPGVVSLAIDLASETVVLVAVFDGPVSKAELLSTHIHSVNPQYTFYSTVPGSAVFIYTCPSGSKVKERMVYAVNRKSVTKAAIDAGITITKELEGSDSADVEDSIEDEGQAAPKAEKLVSKPRFNRPKAPGRR